MRPCLFLMILSIASNSLYAYSGFSVCNHGNETLSSVMCDGPSVLKQTQITGDMNIAGTLQADGISVTSMKVIGETRIANATVRGSVNVVGDLSASHVVFSKGIAIQSNNILLNHTTVDGLVIVTSPDKTPYVQIQCGSDVKGSVMFDGKAGVVQITGDSILRGKVVNGSTEFVKRDCSE